MELTVFADLIGGGEGARVNVPDAAAELVAEQRWWLAFDVMRRACEQLQQVAGERSGPWPLLAVEMLAGGRSSGWSVPGRPPRIGVTAPAW
jgi:hypothetical protein